MDDARERLVALLGGAARRLMLARAAEAAAVCAAGGGMAAAALELAWIVAGWSRLAAAVVCAAGQVGGAAALLRWSWRPGRPATEAQQLGVLAWVVLFGGAIIVMAAGSWYAYVSRGWLTALIPAGALAGALAVIVRGASVRMTAVFLDVRAGTGERLSTAVELAGSDQAGTPAARYIYAQALETAAASGAAHVPLWRRTRATAGALGLVIVLCGALAMLPSPGQGQAESKATRTSAASPPRELKLVRMPADFRTVRLVTLAGMSPQRRAALADALRQAAEAEKDHAKAQAMRDAADALEAGDAEALQRKLEALAAAGANVPQSLTDALASAQGAASRPSQVAVYDAAYAKALAARKDPKTADAGLGEGMVPRDDAWAAARRRAQEALASPRRIPPEYRQLVRDFFLADGKEASR